MEVENGNSGVRFTRDFPPECSKTMSYSTSVSRFYTYTRDFPAGCSPNAPKKPQVLPEKTMGGVKRENCGSSDNDSHLWRRPSTTVPLKRKPLLGGSVSVDSDIRNLNPISSRVPLGMGGGMNVRNPSKVKFFDMRDSKSSSRRVEGEKKDLMGVSKEREKVVSMLALFRGRCDEYLKIGGVKRVDIEAYRELTREAKIMKQAYSVFGDVPGVEIGDKFYYRIELVIVGLHRLFQGGIDSMECNGERCATCIVANERHLDKMNDPNVLSYIGEGGTQKRNEVGVPPDQQLIAGNLALNNSRKSKRPVRVVRGLAYGGSREKILYVYDGLYEVSDAVKKKGPQGNMIFEFQMTRKPGQPAVPWSEYRRAFV